MQTVFARFRDRATAERAIEEMRSKRDRISVILHEHASGHLGEQAQQSASAAETDGRHGFFVGIVTGVLVGSLMGALLGGVFDLAPSIPSGVAFGAVTGIMVGGIMSGLFGLGLTDRRLARLADKLGPAEVLVTLQLTDDAARLDAEQTISSHGGRFEKKALV